jgi:ribosomal protein L37AE/L43A
MNAMTESSCPETYRFPEIHPDEANDGAHCAACGERRHLHRGDGQEVWFCFDCLEGASFRPAYGELGVGD